jgi:uncharacterized protein (TIGR04222 family)
MVTPVTAHGTQLSAEEIGFLTAGPGRAAETALARLLDAGLVRVSRTGLVSAVHQNNYGATTRIETRVLAQLRTPARFDTVVQKVAYSSEMNALHQRLIEQKLMQRPRHRNEMWWAYLAIAGVLVVGGLAFPPFFIGVPIALLLFVWTRGREAVTSTGKEALRKVTAHDRVHAVAMYGFCGRIGGQQVADLFEISQSIVRMLPLKQNKKKKSSSDGGGCGSASSCSSCGSGCGGSSCSSSSSGSSCSSGSSSCGGGGCGGGGGGD